MDDVLLHNYPPDVGCTFSKKCVRCPVRPDCYFTIRSATKRKAVCAQFGKAYPVVDLLAPNPDLHDRASKLRERARSLGIGLSTLYQRIREGRDRDDTGKVATP